MSMRSIRGGIVYQADGASLGSRIRQLVGDAAKMWREAYDPVLTDRECDDLTAKLLNAFGIDLPSWRRISEESGSEDFHYGDDIRHHPRTGG